MSIPFVLGGEERCAFCRRPAPGPAAHYSIEAATWQCDETAPKCPYCSARVTLELVHYSPSLDAWRCDPERVKGKTPPTRAELGLASDNNYGGW